MQKGMTRHCKKSLYMPVVEVTESVMEKINQYRQKAGSETGGIIMGSIINERKIRINRISQPCVILTSRCGCTRDAKKANGIIQREFEASNHTRVYLGEWHTHPENMPTPSRTDYQSVRDIFRNALLPYNRIIILIIGLKSEYWSCFNGKRFSKIATINIV